MQPSAPSYPPRYRVSLAKEDFKFSSAHFTLFPDGSAELLHGHNYQVQLEVSGDRLDELGLLCDFEQLKRTIRALCDELDSRMLLPERCAQLDLRREGDEVEVRFDRRRYCFPAADVLLLPLVNTSVEELATWLWQRVADSLRQEQPTAMERLSWLGIDVGETAGQGCRYLRPFLSSDGS